MTWDCWIASAILGLSIMGTGWILGNEARRLVLRAREWLRE